jgi:tetratricopeptide (TPR) repeat protein
VTRIACGLAVVLWAAPSYAQTAKPAAPAASSSAPADRQALLEHARLLHSQKRDVEAMAELRRAAQEFQSVQALLLLARLQAEQKNAAGALASLKQARAWAPNSEEVLNAYAEGLSASATPDAAIPMLDALVRLCPTVGAYHQRLGVALLRAGDAEAAVAALQEAERLAPDQAPTLVALGRALARRGLYADAKPLMVRAVSLTPDDLDAVAALADVEAGLGEMKDAEEHARRVLARAAGHPTANAAWAAVLMKQEHYAEARDALQKAAAADPAGDYEVALGRACTGLHDSAGAEAHAALHRQKAKAADARVQRLRRETSFGMRRAQS